MTDLGFLIGLDGGGAKTAAALCDGEGRVLARARGPGSAIVGLPGADFFAIVEPIVADLIRAAGVGLDRVDHMAMGLSGVDYPDETLVQHRLIAARLGLGERLVLVNDGLVALWGAAAAERLTLVQHGSGVTTAYRPRHGSEAIYDSLDVAAVYDLRRAAVAQTARMIDGRAAPTALRERVLAHCGVPASGFVEWCMRGEGARERRAALASVVFEAWSEGDPAAADMVRRAADDYVLTTAVMGRILGEGDFQAAFSGGVIAQGGAAFQALIEDGLRHACPQARRVDPLLAPELGALLLAGWRAGLQPHALLARLAATETAPCET